MSEQSVRGVCKPMDDAEKAARLPGGLNEFTGSAPVNPGAMGPVSWERRII